MAEFKLDAMKVVGLLAAIIVSLSSAYVALLVTDIRGDISAVTGEVDRLKKEEVKKLLSQVNQMQIDLNRESFNKQNMIYRLGRLEKDIEDLEEKIP
jgi:hypothetical protein